MLRAPCKSLARQILLREPVLGAVRGLTRSSLPWNLRTTVHRRVGKHLTLTHLPPFDVKPPYGPLVRLAHGPIADYLWWLGAYEPTTMQLFCRLAAEASMVLDIGARDGIFSLFAAAANPLARVLAFEPDPEAVRMLRANLALNVHLNVSRLTAVDVALGATDGHAAFYLAGGNSSLNPGFRPGAASMSVVVRRGDALLAELAPGQPVGLVKVDTESTEPDVLEGLELTVSRDRPVIFCEVLPGRSEDRLQEFVERNDYAAWRITREGLVPLPRVVGDSTYREPNVALAPSNWAIPADVLLCGGPTLRRP